MSRIPGPPTIASVRAGSTELPDGNQTTITDVLTQLPGVAVDQNQQIHIRNTEGPQFQYQINGLLVPLDINTNPPFLSMLNYAVHPAAGPASGGVAGALWLRHRRRGRRAEQGWLQRPGRRRQCRGGPAIDALAERRVRGLRRGAQQLRQRARDLEQHRVQQRHTGSDTDPRSAAAHRRRSASGPTRSRRRRNVTLLLSATRSDNELPNAPNLTPQFTLAGVTAVPNSARHRFAPELSRLSSDGRHPHDHRGRPGSCSSATRLHYISQQFQPDPVGELIYQGVASQATHEDADQTLQGDLRCQSGPHTLAAGFYVGDYRVQNSVHSLVFPANADGSQSRRSAARAPRPAAPPATSSRACTSAICGP